MAVPHLDHDVVGEMEAVLSLPDDEGPQLGIADQELQHVVKQRARLLLVAGEQQQLRHLAARELIQARGAVRNAGGLEDRLAAAASRQNEQDEDPRRHRSAAREPAVHRVFLW